MTELAPRIPSAPRDLMGPILRWELTAIARKARYFLVRAGYAALLLITLWMTYQTAFRFLTTQPGQDIQAFSRFAAGFFTSFLITQLLVAVGLTPAFVATAIPMEKERKTIEYLFVSDLTNREIVLGKLLARVTNLLMVLLVGVPVVALAALFGGIDYIGLLTTTAATCAVMLSVAAASMVISLYSSTSRRALTQCYGLLFAVIMILPSVVAMGLGSIEYLLRHYAPTIHEALEDWPNQEWFQFAGMALVSLHPLSPMWIILSQSFGVTGAMASPLSAAALIVSVHVVLAGLFTFWAIARLRASYRVDVGKPVTSNKFRDRMRNWSIRKRRSVSEHRPLFWKEIHCTKSRSVGIWVRLAIAGIIIYYYITFGAILFDDWNRPDRMKDNWQQFSSMTSIGLMVFAYLLTAFRAASSIGEEKDRDCWISLLSTPLTRRQIVFEKAFGAMHSVQPFVIITFPVLLFGVAVGGINLMGLAFWLASVLSSSFTIAALGTYQSFFRKSTTMAIGMTIFFASIFSGLGQLFTLPMAFVLEDAYLAISLGSMPWTPLALSHFLTDRWVGETFEIFVTSLVFMTIYPVVGYLLLERCVYGFESATGRIEGGSTVEPIVRPLPIRVDSNQRMPTPGSEEYRGQ